MSAVRLDHATAHTLTRTTDGAGTLDVQTRVPFDTALTLDAASTPAVTEGGFTRVAMSAGAATIDLTSFTDVTGRTVSLTGLKPRSVKVKALDANAGAITIAKGATNGYGGFGGSFSLSLQPGAEATFYVGSGGTAVAGGSKTLDLSGTLTDGVEFSIAAGG